MLYIDFEADTEKEAVQLALDSLGLTQDDITWESLQKEKKGIFGLGKKEKAKVRIFYKEKSEVNGLIENVKKVISLLDPAAQIDVTSSEDNRYVLAVESADSSHLIGKNGNNLHALQNIVNSMALKYDNKYRVLIDIDKYYARKEKSVLNQALDAAREVLRSGQPVLLQPMNPFERRLVHVELTKMKGIVTHSEGDGRIKKIRISSASAQENAKESAPETH
ncbi:MAG: Jag N-terminal domain-containing protein [Spirochaetia bacterium]|nr:Jag N-terminal domain-containing protein [Spirochaetia bacterium]